MPGDPLIDATDAQAGELRAIAHSMWSYHHQLVQSGLDRDLADELLRDYHRAFWHAALVDGYEPGESVTKWPPPSPLGSNVS